jgi:hypothetical protein
MDDLGCFKGHSCRVDEGPAFQNSFIAPEKWSRCGSFGWGSAIVAA